MTYLSSHQASWAEDYLTIRQAILAIEGLTIRLDHIGSTAIEGLMAKPCIDVLGQVSSLSHLNPAIPLIKQLGFTCRGAYGIAGRIYFSRATETKCHLHVFATGHPAIEQHLNFVRVMSHAPEKIKEFNQLKQRLQQRYPNDKQAYQRAKAGFYQQLDRCKIQ